MNETPQSSPEKCNAVQPPPPPRGPTDTRNVSGRFANVQTDEIDHLERLFGYYDPTSLSAHSDVLIPCWQSIFRDFFSGQIAEVERLRDYCTLHQNDGTDDDLVRIASLEILQTVIKFETESSEDELGAAARWRMLVARVKIYSWFDNIKLWATSASVRSDTTSTVAVELTRHVTPRSSQHASLHRWAALLLTHPRLFTRLTRHFTPRSRQYTSLYRWEVQKYLGPHNLSPDCAVIREKLLADIVISGKTSNFKVMTGFHIVIRGF